MSDQIWEIPDSLRVSESDKKRWTHLTASPVAKTARDDGGKQFKYSFNSNKEHGLFCTQCENFFVLPVCAKCSGGVAKSYHGVLLRNGGAALSCKNCSAIFFAWHCPCGAMHEVNTSIAQNFGGGGACGTCLIILGVLAALYVLAQLLGMR